MAPRPLSPLSEAKTAVEPTHQGHAHAHAVLETDLSVVDVTLAWQRGRKQVERYDPSRGWRYYIPSLSVTFERETRGRPREA